MELGLTIAAQVGLLLLTGMGPVMFFLGRMREAGVAQLAPARAYGRPVGR